jgi:hypothetical protein
MGKRAIEVEPAEAFTAVLDRFRRRFGSKHSTVRLDRLVVHSTSTSLGSANIGADQDGHKGRFYPYAFLRARAAPGGDNPDMGSGRPSGPRCSQPVQALASTAQTINATLPKCRGSMIEDTRLNPALSYASSKRGLHEKISYVSRYERNSKLPFLSVFVRARGAQANGVTPPEHVAPLSRDLPRDPVPACGSPDQVHHATLSVGERPPYNPKYAFYYRMKRNSWRNNLKPPGDLGRCPVLPVSAAHVPSK